MDFFYLPFLSGFVADSDCKESKSTNPAQFELLSNSGETRASVSLRYKLTYFNCTGIAEMIRLILAYRNVDFIDCRLEYDQWIDKLDTISYQLLPLLEFDGKMICQAPAIARYLARIYGLAGKDPYEQAQVDSVVDILKDFFNAYSPIFGKMVCKHQDFNFGLKHPEVIEPLVAPFQAVCDRFMPLIQAAAKNSAHHDHGFIFESGITYADFAVASFCEVLELVISGITAKYAPLDALAKRVFSLPELQSYLKKRPNFPMKMKLEASRLGR